jgi:WD40 repeat protein/archaellum biogenesis ATPase FlaH
MNSFPYPGLRPFERDEIDIFFGRDEISNKLIERLGDTHFIAVVGPSGCGKSSIVRTGLLAGLNLGFLQTAGTQWQVATLRPGIHPFTSLAKALLEDSTLTEKYTSHFTDKEKAAKYLSATLSRGPSSLLEFLKDLSFPQNTNLLLIVDQFEELFRYRQHGNIDESMAFVRLLLESKQHPNVYVIITMRSEFIGDCALFHDLLNAINQGLFVTPRLNLEQLRLAIEGPAKVFEGQIESSLVNLLLNKMEIFEKTVSGPEQLPVLQHALMRMWDRARPQGLEKIRKENLERMANLPSPKRIMTLKHYQEIGELDNALSQHADEAYTRLTQKTVLAEPQKVAEILFRRLCERDKAHRDTRSPARLDEIAELAKLPSWQQLVPVMDEFRQAGRHFLMFPLGPELQGDSIVDISHESLIKHWKRLKDWSEKEAKSADMYRRLEATAILKEKGEAELWKGLDLANVSDWFKREKPTQIWAKRYGKNEGQYFDTAVRFLEDSEKKQKQEQQEKEAARLQKEQEKEVARLQKLKQARTIAIGTTMGLVITVGIAIWGYGERNAAISAKKERTINLFDSQLTHATLTTRDEDYAGAKEILKETYKLDAEIRAASLHARNLLAWFDEFMGEKPEYVYEGAEVPLSSVAISYDGKLLATAGENGILVLFDAKSGQLLQRLEGHKSHVKTTVFYPQNHWLASAGYDKRIILWSLATGKPVKEWKTSEKVWTLAVSPNGDYLASGGKGNEITLWDVKTGSKRPFIGHEDDVKGLAFSYDGKLLASASYDDTVRLWNVATNQESHKLIGHTDDVYAVAFSHDDKWLASGSEDKTVRLWEVNSGKLKNSLLGHKKMVFGVGFSADGRYVVSASDDMTLRMWDTDSGVTMRVFQKHTAGVNGVVISPAGKVFSVSDDATVMRWNPTLPYQQAIDFVKTPLATAIAPDSNSVAVGFKDGTLRLYALPDIRLLWEQQTAHAKELRRIAFNSDGSQLASASADKTAKLWQAKDGTLIQTFTGHKDVVNAVAFAPNDNILATASFGGQVGLFTIGTEQKIFYKPHDGKDVNTIAFDANGAKLLSTGDEDVRLWNLNNEPPTLLEKYSKTTNLIWSALSPNSKQIASVGRDQLVHVYSTTDQSITYRLKGHENTIYRVIFSQDGQQIATVSSDATLRVWDLRDGMALLKLRLPTNSGKPVPLKDFDFRCSPKGGDCWIAVPLTRGKLMLYKLENIYDNAQ